MKRILNSILLIIVLFFSACTDVIDVEVPNEEAKLVIEASINWEKGTSGSDQTIYLSKSTPFFDTNGNVPVVGASVVITNNNDGSFFEFNDQNDGSYTTSNFIPVLNDNYTLEVMSEGETYNAQETFVPVVPILEVYQSTEKFLPEVLEVNFDFLDPVEEENYYYIKFKERQENEDINQVEYAPGDTVNMELIGISKRYYEYIQLLINQSESGGPFDTTPVALRGNCTNQNDPNNFAYGYFRLTEVAKASYTFE